MPLLRSFISQDRVLGELTARHPLVSIYHFTVELGVEVLHA